MLDESKEQRVVLFSGPADVQVHVIERVDRPQRVPDVEAGATLHANVDDAAGFVRSGGKARIVEHASLPVAAGTQVNIGERSHADRFVDGTKR